MFRLGMDDIVAERVAAKSLRMVWEAHDKKDEEMGMYGAAQLYSVLGGQIEQLFYAGILTIQAYFLADEAEGFQNIDPQKEDFYYGNARENLEKARAALGFETVSPTYTVQWWKAFTHKDNEGTIRGLTEEHKAQLPHLAPDERERYAKMCVEKLSPAINLRMKRQWEDVEKVLEDYFRIYLEAWEKGS